MTQSHAQIKLTPKPINLEDAISFVSHEGSFTCSYSRPSSKKNIATYSEKDIEAQAAMAKMELDAIILYAFEEFNISKIAIHSRLGSYALGDTIVGFALSSNSKEDTEQACEAVTAKLNGLSESWNEKEFTGDNIWIKN